MNIEVPIDNSTVSKIIKAAIPLFAVKGFKGVSVKEVAGAANVNVALISYYFGGKENLYTFILKKQMASLGKEVEAIQQAQIDPIQKIRCFVTTIAKLEKQNPYADRFLHNEILNPTKCFDAIVKVEVSRLDRFLKECISEAVAAGQFRSDLDISCATLSLVNIMNFNFITRSLCAGLLPDREDLAEYYVLQALEIYLDGVSKKN